MEKDISKLLKQIRNDNNLTQSQFAKKLFTSDRTISHYENGTRNPDINFLSLVCETFSLSLDYFSVKSNKEESMSTNLTVVKNSKNKCAIFDKSKSSYLTPHLYDRILLSEGGHHIVIKNDDYKDDKGIVHRNAGNINYSAIADNFGNVKEYPNLIYGISNGFYKNSCPATSKETGRQYLANYEGKIISKDFWKVTPVDWNHNFGLYYGIEKAKNADGLLEDKSRVLLSKDGEELDLKIERNPIYPQIIQIANGISIAKACSYIKKYGPNIILLLPDDIFKNNENYNLIIKAMFEHLIDNPNEYDKIYYMFDLLNQKADIFAQEFVETKFKDKSIFEDLLKSGINRIIINYVKKRIMDLYSKIKLK